MKTKKEYLITPMHQLGIHALKKYFFQKGMSDSDVITLGDFFSLNPNILFRTYFHFNNRSCFVCFKSGRLSEKQLHQDSSAYHALRTFLLANGFNHQDWPMLLPKQGNGELDYGKLDKKILTTLPVTRVVSIQRGGLRTSPFVHAAERLWKKREFDTFSISVRDVLKITERDIEKHIGSDRRILQTLEVIQKTFRSWEFSIKDGPFMKIPLYVQPKDKAQWVEYLMQQKAFGKEEVENLLELIEKANVRMTVL